MWNPGRQGQWSWVNNVRFTGSLKRQTLAGSDPLILSAPEQDAQGGLPMAQVREIWYRSGRWGRGKSKGPVVRTSFGRMGSRVWLKVRQWELEEGSWRPHLEAGRVHTLYPMPPILRHKGLDTSAPDGAD